MAGFLYYREGPNTLRSDEIDKLGLRYAFAGRIQSGGINGNNQLSGKPGVVFADPARHEGKHIGYFPDQQTWRKLPNVEGRPECWVGYWNDAKPEPVELARARQLKGVPLTLADGREWDIPIVRMFDSERQEWVSRLPTAWDCDEEGNLVPSGTPKSVYAHLWDLTAPLADRIFAIASGEEVDWVNDAQVGKVVTAILQTNYHVGPAEIGALEIVGGDEAFAIVAVASRYDTLQDWLDQKKTSDSSATSGATISSGEAA